MAELKKENFGLKLRIYHLEEALQKKAGAGNEDWEMVCVFSPLFDNYNTLYISSCLEY